MLDIKAYNPKSKKRRTPIMSEFSPSTVYSGTNPTCKIPYKVIYLIKFWGCMHSTQNVLGISTLPLARVWVPYSLTLSVTPIWTRTVLSRSLEVLHHGVVVGSTQHPALHQTKLLPCGQLPLTGVAGEAGQVVHTAPRPPHPVTGIHLAPALATLGAKLTVVRQRRAGGIVSSLSLLMKINL